MRQKMLYALYDNAVRFAAVASLIFAIPVLGAKDTELEKKMQKLRELEEKKRSLEAKMKTGQQDGQLSGEKLAEVIARYEKLFNDCAGKKSERCADVMFNLARFYYMQDGEKYILAREDYEKKIAEWERTGSGAQPVNPVPDYSRSLEMYRKLALEYPSFTRNDEAYYQIGFILDLGGNIDGSAKAYQEVIDRFPNSPRASSAYFRLGIFAYLDNDPVKALRYLEMVKPEKVTPEVREMVHYRKAELYYNQGALDKAAEFFYTYVEKCDAGEFPKKEFRDIALSGMAVCFSEMPGGATEAIKFFKKIGGRPYEPYVIYTVGAKNREQGQFDDAIIALRTALKNYPYYKDAPIAQHLLVECLVVKKQMEEANKERERLVDSYQPGSEWYNRNSKEKAIIEQAQNYVRRALSNIAIYLHGLAAKSKDKSLYEKSLKRYQEFFQKFSDDKWRTLEMKYNAAEVYNELQQYDKAVELYWAYATEDISKYPPYKADIDSLLFDDPKEYEEAVQKAQKKGALSVPQADAGYNAIVALDNARKKKIAMGNLKSEQAYALPETQKLIENVHLFQQKFPQNVSVPELLYLAGNVQYEAKAYDKAIMEFDAIVTAYPKSQIADKAFRMLAKSYSSSGQHDLAVKKYRELLARTDPKTADYHEVVDLAAAAIYSKADDLKKSGNKVGAADIYKSIFSEFPSSKIADRGWFEAAVCFEEEKNYEMAAQIFEKLPAQFPKSTLAEKAFVRAAENYKNAQKWEMAGNVYLKASTTIIKADFAIPSLSSASKCYDTIGNQQMAGQVLEETFKRYPDDARTPQALYSAGLIYEKGRLYDRAISVYVAVSEKFPKSEYAEDAAFSIGICYDSLNKPVEAAQSFADFAKKFDNRVRQVEALVRAGDAYFKMNNHKEAEANYQAATTLFEKFKGKGDFGLDGVSRAYCRLGEIYGEQFKAIKLTGRNEKEVKDKLKDKAKALEKSLKPFAQAIELGLKDWVLKSTYMIGMSYVELAEAERTQDLFGSKDQKAAAQIQIIMKLDKYYIKAQEKFAWNIEKAQEQNLKGEYVDKSIEMFTKMGYLLGHLFEEVGELFANAPIPPGMEPEEKKAYQELLEEKRLQSLDGALPKYEAAVRDAAELGIAKTVYLDSIKLRIKELNPGSEALELQVKEWMPKEDAAEPDKPVKSGETSFRRSADQVNKQAEQKDKSKDSKDKKKKGK